MGLGTKNVQFVKIHSLSLYWKVAIPSLLYSVENLRIAKQEIVEFVSQLHVNMAKMFAGAHRKASGPNVLKLSKRLSLSGMC